MCSTAALYVWYALALTRQTGIREAGHVSLFTELRGFNMPQVCYWCMQLLPIKVQARQWTPTHLHLPHQHLIQLNA